MLAMRIIEPLIEPAKVGVAPAKRRRFVGGATVEVEKVFNTGVIGGRQALDGRSDGLDDSADRLGTVGNPLQRTRVPERLQ